MMESNLTFYFTTDNPKTAEYYNLVALQFEYRSLAIVAFVALILFQWQHWVLKSGEHLPEVLIAATLYVVWNALNGRVEGQLQAQFDLGSPHFRESRGEEVETDDLTWGGRIAFTLNW